MKRSIPEGAGFLACWIIDVFETGIQQLQKVRKTILMHGEDILNFFKHRVSKGKNEGVNNDLVFVFRGIIYFKL